MLTPTEEREVLRDLPAKFERDEIFGMVAALQADLAKDEPGLDDKTKVFRHGKTHKRLLVSLPLVFRSVCRGTFRPAVIDNILAARELMDRGVDKKEAMEFMIKRAVDEVNGLRRAQSGRPSIQAPPATAESPDTQTS